MIMALPGFTAEVSLRDSAQYKESRSFEHTVATIQPALPCIYGRWCGPGCSGPGSPINDVDACCKVHDECYDRKGYFACSCDRELLACLAPKRSIWTSKGRAAIAVWSYFKVAPCNPFK
jgi:hypothetical protein